MTTIRTTNGTKMLKNRSALIESINQNKLETLTINRSLAAGTFKLNLPNELINPNTEIHVLAESKKVVILNHHISPNGMNLVIQAWIYDITNNICTGKNSLAEPYTFEISSNYQPFRGQRGYVGSYIFPEANRLVLAIERDGYWDGTIHPANASGRGTELHVIDLNTMTIKQTGGVRSYATISVDKNKLIVCPEYSLEIYENGIEPLCNFVEERLKSGAKSYLYEMLRDVAPRNIKSALVDFSYHRPLIYTIDNGKDSKNSLRRHNHPNCKQYDYLLSGYDKILKLKIRNQQKLETVYCRLLDGSLSLVTISIDRQDIKYKEQQQIVFDHHRENEKILDLELYNDATGTEFILAETIKPKNKQETTDTFYIYIFDTHYHEKLGKIKMSSPVLANALLTGDYVMKESNGLAMLSCHQISPNDDLIPILEALENNTSVKEFYIEEQDLTPTIMASLAKLKQKRNDLILHLPQAVVIQEEEKESQLSVVLLPSSQIEATPVIPVRRLSIAVPPMLQIEDESLPAIQEIKAEGPPGGPLLLPEREESCNSHSGINRALRRVSVIPVASSVAQDKPEQKEKDSKVQNLVGALPNTPHIEDAKAEKEEERNIYSPRSPSGFCSIL